MSSLGDTSDFKHEDRGDFLNLLAYIIIAGFGTAIILLCGYAISKYPQILVIFIFSIVFWAICRVIKNH